MNEPQHLSEQQVRVSHTEPRLQSFSTDRMEAWGIVGMLLVLPLVYSWSMFPVMAAIAGVLAAALLASAAVSWVRRKIVKRRREGAGESCP